MAEGEEEEDFNYAGFFFTEERLERQSLSIIRLSVESDIAPFMDYLPHGLRSIGARSFEDSTSSASVSIPGSVLLVGISALEKDAFDWLLSGWEKGLPQLDPMLSPNGGCD